MRQLNSEEIEKLASRPLVRRIAVENFLATMGEDRHAAIANLQFDARSYKWNAETKRAISAGIRCASGAW